MDAAFPKACLNATIALPGSLRRLQNRSSGRCSDSKAERRLSAAILATIAFRSDLDFTLTAQASADELKARWSRYMQPRPKPRALYLPLIGKTAKSTRTVTRFTSGYEGPLPRGNNVKVDITLREMLVYALQERPVLRRHEELTDLPESRIVRAYSLEEITTEKTLALADRARNEPRDLYDLWHLTSNEGVELGALAGAMRQKLEFRGKPSEGLAEAIRAKEGRLKALWDKRLAYQMIVGTEGTSFITSALVIGSITQKVIIFRRFDVDPRTGLRLARLSRSFTSSCTQPRSGYFFGGAITSLTALATLNLTTVLALILIASPV